jgi:hypothetical protein
LSGGIVSQLHDPIGPFALLLRQGDDRGVVLAQVVSHACAQVPLIGQLIADIELLCRGLESLLLDSAVRLGVQVQSLRYRHQERAAEVLRIRDRCLSWR